MEELTLRGLLSKIDTLQSDILSYQTNISDAAYSISSLTIKLERLLKQLSTVNGYVASNNFKSNKPEQDKLTQFAIKCMSNSGGKITRDLLPSGTKIKNTFDNHLWVLNKISIDGLVTYRWEDFGSDEICIANNDGVHGLVTGSNEKYQGYIDLLGVISINGLVDDIDNILQSLLSVGKIVKEYDERLLKIESMLGLSNKE